MTEKEELLFVGGVVDGSKISVSTGIELFTFPFGPEKIMLKTPKNDHEYNTSVRVAPTAYRYQRITFYVGPDKLSVMAHTSLTSQDVMKLLISKYVGSVAN